MTRGGGGAGGAAVLGIYAYHPFGEEASQAQQEGIRLRFTGHERDGRGAGFADDLDYMHARYYSPGVGRFLSVDPAMESAEPMKPQTWNRYSYVGNRPLNYIDPDGLRQNPVTGQTGIDPTPKQGAEGRIRANKSNPRVGSFGFTRTRSDGSKKFHAGVDINAQKGTPVYAAEDGVVIDIGVRGVAGNRVQLKTQSGETLTYAHLDSLAGGLKAGTIVGEGESLGTAGTTGNAAGIPQDEQHLHFTVMDSKGKVVDPVKWLNDPNAPAARIVSQQPGAELWQQEATCACSLDVDPLKN